MDSGMQRNTIRFWKRIALITGAVIILGSGLAVLLRQPIPPAPQVPPMPQDSTLPFSKGTKLAAISDLVAWAIQPGRDGFKILFTETQGLKWMDRTPGDLSTEVIIPYPNSPAAWFVDGRQAYIALAIRKTTAEGSINYQTVLFKTADSGVTWTRRTLETGGNHDVPINLFFQDDNRGWLMTEYSAAGGDSPETKKVFRTIDGGQTWSALAKVTQ